MAAADVLRRVQTADPSVEVVVLTCSDGETYSSQKFSDIKAAVAIANADDDAALNVTYSGQVATVNWNGVTDKAVTLVLYG